MKEIALAFIAVVFACLTIYYIGDHNLFLISLVAFPGFLMGFVSQKLYAHLKPLQFDSLVRDFRYAKMRHDLRKSIKS